MHPLRLHSPFSDAAAAARAAAGPGVSGRTRPWAGIGKGVAAFVVGLLIGASAILVAEIVTPAGGVTAESGAPSFDQGPLQLRR